MVCAGCIRQSSDVHLSIRSPRISDASIFYREWILYRDAVENQGDEKLGLASLSSSPVAMFGWPFHDRADIELDDRQGDGAIRRRTHRTVTKAGLKR